jgi:hypothetical protein
MSAARKSKRPAPFAVRLTEAEKAALKARAGSRPLGAYIREMALDGLPEARRRRSPVRDGEALGRALGLLGQSRIANNLNQIAKAANQGSLPVTDEVEADLRAACAHIAEIRCLLLEALGKKLPPAPAPSLAPEFAKAAAKRELHR